ncbi:MAG TPA: cyclic nucleotide-binding protein, partial [Acidimicrobiia bacterium]|nr:cyclic nucleotide-binding protein [Acidimicrobiia bacterium]
MTEDPSAPTLTAEQLSVLERFGRRRRVDAGEILYAEGDATYDFYVMLSGVVEITGAYDGED